MDTRYLWECTSKRGGNARCRGIFSQRISEIFFIHIWWILKHNWFLTKKKRENRAWNQVFFLNVLGFRKTGSGSDYRSNSKLCFAACHRALNPYFFSTDPTKMIYISIFEKSNIFFCITNWTKYKCCWSILKVWGSGVGLKIGSGALYLKQREIFKNLMKEYFR